MDVVAFDRALPEVKPKDHIILHDTGAYYHASFSYYNSRCPPILIGYRQNENNVPYFEQMCKLSTVHDTVKFYAP